VGIRAIEYRPWKGDRTDPNQRWLVISKHVFQKNVRAKAVIVLLILGMMFAHAFPIIGAIFTPHEGITDEDMVGNLERYDQGTDSENFFNVTEGDLEIDGDLVITGDINLTGSLYIGYYMDDKTAKEIENNTGSYPDREVPGVLTFGGNVTGIGVMTGNDFMYYQQGFLVVNGFVRVFTNVTYGNFSIEEPPDPLGMMGNLTTVSGFGMISGYGNITGNGTLSGELIPGESPSDTFDGYFSGIIIIFTMLLAAIICADIISADLANSSFVLYFSRPVRSFDYLLGKFVGLMWVMWIFCLIPPIMYVLVMIGTQSGDEFSTGFKILGKTVLVGLVTAIYFLPYGLMISSLTKSKAYAGIGIFMSFFVLLIISEIFSETSDKWSLISPVELLMNFYKITFNAEIPAGITAGQVGGAILAFTLIPMAVVIYWIQRKGAGK